MHLDPFEEIKMAEESADQHRRSASEKEVTNLNFISLSTFCFRCFLNQVI